jgi:hypothetical protein
MTSATQDQQVQAEVPQPHDPEREIDAKSATKWFIGGSLVLFVTLWILLPIFVRVQEVERMKKVDLTPNAELATVREAQTQFLNGANPTKKTVEQAMLDALKK